MRDRLAGFAALLALLAVLGKFYAKPLLSQVRAALVENVDEPGRNPYSSTKSLPGICIGNNACNLFFTPVPAGKRLVVTSITGNIYPLTPGIVHTLTLFATGTGGIQKILVPTFLEAGTIDFGNIVGVSAQLTAYYEPGDAPRMEVETTTSFIGPRIGSLTISGYFVNLP